MAKVYFLTHPDVIIDKSIPVPSWQLSDEGVKKTGTFLKQPFIKDISYIYSSSETKAVQTAQIISSALKIEPAIINELGEVNRSSTGYLEAAEHEKAVDALFGLPLDSYRGWETALDAQRRIWAAVEEILRQKSDGGVLLISHGAVGSFLLARLLNRPISRDLEQKSLGSYFIFDAESKQVLTGWNQL